MVQVRGQWPGPGAGERWADGGYFVEGELTGFADGLNIRGEGKGIKRENT